VLMKTTRAKQLLRWRPKHTARATLKEMAEGQRALRYSSA
jgi:nucleoside-diphosphate-sugar epimerase